MHILKLFRAFIFGQMEEDMKDSGKQITCMEKDFIHGKMVDNIKENI